MQASSLVTVVFLVTAAWAGGYQGAVERLLLFYAYEIDGLNPPEARTLGIGCLGRFWDSSTRTCRGDNYKECRGKRGGRCNFNELMLFLGKLENAKQTLVGPDGSDQNTRTPDIEETAKKVYAAFKGATPNFPSWKAMKGADGVFNHFLEDLDSLVSTAASRYRNPGNEDIFNRFKSAAKQAQTARVGDHGSHLIKAAQEKLGKEQGMEIKTLQAGVNPIDSTRWETVDWEATLQDAKAKGISDAAELISDFQVDFYRGTSAASHRAVVQAYEKLVVSC